MLNTMAMSVFERTREIGILRAIGWRPGRIMQMILMESSFSAWPAECSAPPAPSTLTFFLSRLPPPT